MESLDNTSWDVVIAGTGIQQSLLALSLSRSNLKILHLDRNDHYGGAEAALSLQEAEAWVKRVNSDTSPRSTFSDAAIENPHDGRDGSKHASKLSFSRAYSLALAPQLIYSRSELLPKLVSSKVYRQLEFLAVGSWFTYDSDIPPREESSPSQGTLKRIPSSREDVFADASLDLNGRRRLMKFLRFIGDYEQSADQEWQNPTSPLYGFTKFLELKFGIPQEMQDPIMALALPSNVANETHTEDALRNISRHLRSIGVFGRGFGSVFSKWGGLSEIVQVGCRAAAVGGATYVLDKSIVSLVEDSETEIKIELQGGEIVITRWLIGCDDDLAFLSRANDWEPAQSQVWCHSISVVDSPLSALFPSTSEGSPAPAGAMVYISGDTVSRDAADSASAGPVYIHVHSSDTGVLYACLPTAAANPSAPGLPNMQARLDSALAGVLAAAAESESQSPQVSWRLRYTQRSHHTPLSMENRPCSGRIVAFPTASAGVAFDDGVLKRVKQAWRAVMPDDADEDGFMVFEDRETGYDDDEGNDDV